VVVQIRLLGGVIAATDGGEPVDVGPAKCQAVLAVLALSAGSPVPVARLVQMVWGEDPPRTAEKTLQSYVARLRKGLGPASIVRAGAAYRLDVDADSVDVARFQRRLASGEVGAALAEWTGAPLAGLAAHGLTGTVDALVEQWLGAVEIDLERRVETDAAAAIGPLTELTANHPFREGLWALLMTALYRVGRQADALAAYHRARRHLVEQLGVEPGPRLRELESLILGHDAQLPVDRARRDSATGIPTGTVTFGCSDVEDSSRLWAMHSHAMAAAMARHDELVRAATERHGGYVFATGATRSASPSTVRSTRCRGRPSCRRRPTTSHRAAVCRSGRGSGCTPARPRSGARGTSARPWSWPPVWPPRPTAARRWSRA
jgi:DNA-binding SARP family transcriptional activator